MHYASAAAQIKEGKKKNAGDVEDADVQRAVYPSHFDMSFLLFFCFSLLPLLYKPMNASRRALGCGFCERVSIFYQSFVSDVFYVP